jgi:hypothetical protein
VPFWRKLKSAQAQIEAVATDMSRAYTLAAAENLPEAVHVFDRFHVVKLFNDKLSALRRQVQNAAQTVEQKKAIKGTRWLLLKNPQNLEEDRDKRTRLDEALRLNQPLATAYYLKEDLRQFWAQPNKDRPAGSSMTGSPGPRHQASACSRNSPEPSNCTAKGCWRGTTSRSQPARWREPTTRSRPCNAKPTASATRPFSA